MENVRNRFVYDVMNHLFNNKLLRRPGLFDELFKVNDETLHIAVKTRLEILVKDGAELLPEFCLSLTNRKWRFSNIVSGKLLEIPYFLLPAMHA